MSTKQKFQLALIFSILSIVPSVTYAQDFYTITGRDSSWSYIISNQLIPVGSNSTAGITGSIIDVNQNHPEIRLSQYANRAIQEDIAIHTLGNSTIHHKEFYRWSRWYQEDGNTQVFRLFKGEINVRNGVYNKPRIEAELDNHSSGTKILNNADWVEWSGTYTIVEPVESNIFQIWSDNDYVLMLQMSNTGKVQLNPRDQSGHKTIFENATSKSFDIKVRDYGTKYEVYLNDDLFYSRNYEARYGSKRAAHFRWGIYASRRSGDHGGVPKNGMMFVTGAQRKYSNETTK